MDKPKVDVLKYHKSVLKSLRKYYGDIDLYESTRKDKKFMVQNPQGRWVHFGQKGYSDWHLHKDLERKNKFKTRNARWANSEKWTPAHLAYWVLWN
jgi:hypothetical protein